MKITGVTVFDLQPADVTVGEELLSGEGMIRSIHIGGLTLIVRGQTAEEWRRAAVGLRALNTATDELETWCFNQADVADDRETARYRRVRAFGDLIAEPQVLLP